MRAQLKDVFLHKMQTRATAQPPAMQLLTPAHEMTAEMW